MNTAGKNTLKPGEAARFESDLFKTNEDIAPVSHRIVQAFVQEVGGGGRGKKGGREIVPPTIQTSVKFRVLVEQRLRSLRMNDL